MFWFLLFVWYFCKPIINGHICIDFSSCSAMGSVSWVYKRLQTESFKGTSMRVATLHNEVGSANSLAIKQNGKNATERKINNNNNNNDSRNNKKSCNNTRHEHTKCCCWKALSLSPSWFKMAHKLPHAQAYNNKRVCVSVYTLSYVWALYIM